MCELAHITHCVGQYAMYYLLSSRFYRHSSNTVGQSTNQENAFLSQLYVSLSVSHIQVYLSQRRLRHLRSIAARNIQLLTNKLGNDVSVIETHFTLHKDNETTSMYEHFYASRCY